MDFCDVCSEPASHMCSYCKEAVYCGIDCQRKDFEEHECIHPDDMTDQQINEEVEIYMECGLKPPSTNHREWIGGLFGTKESRENRKTRKRIRQKKRKLRELKKKKRLDATEKRTDKRLETFK